ncbi:hypothetical protein [Pedobacter sp. ASV12]|uniref:hypothetical protein n=1 Tax=Pedobacter sp. ASV12 TaxID=2795120 RepID=UPI0018EAD045|nr:hypothetical protein [Pedobacter sp. ASV12]
MDERNATKSGALSSASLWLQKKSILMVVYSLVGYSNDFVHRFPALALSPFGLPLKAIAIKTFISCYFSFSL